MPSQKATERGMHLIFELHLLPLDCTSYLALHPLPHTALCIWYLHLALHALSHAALRYEAEYYSAAGLKSNQIFIAQKEAAEAARRMAAKRAEVRLPCSTTRLLVVTVSVAGTTES